MMLKAERAGNTAANVPSPAAPSLCAPSSNIGALEKPPLATLRWRNVTVIPELDSSITRARMVTACVDLGMGGKCSTSEISGGALFVLAELTRPGVPCGVTLGAQFCGTLLSSAGFTNSSDLASPSCSAYHSQPVDPKRR